MVYFSGDIYEGEWENDKRNGMGRHDFVKDNLGVYVGEFIEDKRTGKGRFFDRVK